MPGYFSVKACMALINFCIIVTILGCMYEHCRGVARGGQRGQMPPLFSRKCDTCSLYYDQFIAKQITSYFSQRDLLSI